MPFTLMALCVLSTSDVAPPADTVAAPPVAESATPQPAPTSTSSTTAVANDATRARAALAPFAASERDQRIGLGVAYTTVAAGFIGAGITYVAVSYVDTQLGDIDEIDTRNAGYVMAAVAVVPAAIGIAQFVMPSATEARLEELNDGGDATAIKTDIANDAASPSIVPYVAGGGLIVAGLASAGAGAAFLLLPHTTSGYRGGPVSHATGAELIGIGVTSVGVGAATMVLAGEHEELQLAALSAE